MNRSRKVKAPVKLTSGDFEKSKLSGLSTLLQCSFVHAVLENKTVNLSLKLKSENNQCEGQVFSDLVEGTVTCTSVSVESLCSGEAHGCHRCGEKYEKKESIVKITLKAVDEKCACRSEGDLDNIHVHFKTEDGLPSSRVASNKIADRPVGSFDSLGKEVSDNELLDCGDIPEDSDNENSKDEDISDRFKGDDIEGENQKCNNEVEKTVVNNSCTVQSSNSNRPHRSCRTRGNVRKNETLDSKSTSHNLKIIKDSDSKLETQDSDISISDSEEEKELHRKRRGRRQKETFDTNLQSKGRTKRKVNLGANLDEDISLVKVEKRKKVCVTCGSERKCECIKQYKCPVCDKVFNHASNLRQHKASHTDARPFVCDVCGLGFKTRTNWKTHKSRHAKAFKCDVCGRAFSLAPALKYHIRTHTGERPFQCDTCGMTFTSTGGLRAHKRRHQVKERTFKCDLCEKAFMTKTNLETHVRIHQGVRPFPCPFCNLRFASRPHLNKHKRQHTKEKSFKCDFCSKAFFTQKLLDIHRSKHTGDKRYSCEVCGNKFITSSTLKDHMLLHSAVKPFQCHVCQKQFAANKTLKKHMQIHNTENPLVCEFCGKKCPAAKYLKSHMKMHLGYERHQCNVCGKSYRDPRYLQIHMKSHTGEGLIQCEACGENFADPMYLKLHQKKHCKARKEHCHICGHGFANKNDLGLHMGLHTGDRPFGCETCGKAYTSAEALADHAKRHDFKMKTHQCSICFKRFYTVNDLQRHCRRTQCAKGSRFNLSRKAELKQMQVDTNMPVMDTELERSVAPIIPLTAEEQMMAHPLASSTGGLLTIDRSVIDSAGVAGHSSMMDSAGITTHSTVIDSTGVGGHSSVINSSVTSHVQAAPAGSNLDSALSLAVNTVADGSSYIMYNMMPPDKHTAK